MRGIKSNIDRVIRSVSKKIGPKGTIAKKVATNVRQEAGTILIDSLLSFTPAITGRLRGGWIASTGAPSKGIPTMFNKSGNVTANQSSTIKGLTAGQPLFFANNVPYATAVEFGGPKNIPRAMVARSLQATALELRSKGLKVKIIRGA